MTDGRSDPHTGPGPAEQADARTRGRRKALRGSHPLLGAFPLAVMVLSTFLIVFALMMARLTAGIGPAPRSGGASAVVLGAGSQNAVRTRTSSGALVVSAATPTGAAAPTSTGAVSAVSTRSSGTAGGDGVRDE